MAAFRRNVFHYLTMILAVLTIDWAVHHFITFDEPEPEAHLQHQIVAALSGFNATEIMKIYWHSYWRDEIDLTDTAAYKSCIEDKRGVDCLAKVTAAWKDATILKKHDPFMDLLLAGIGLVQFEYYGGTAATRIIYLLQLSLGGLIMWRLLRGSNLHFAIALPIFMAGTVVFAVLLAWPLAAIGSVFASAVSAFYVAFIGDLWTRFSQATASVVLHGAAEKITPHQ